MPRVLTTNATITCPHGGQGTSVASSPKWTVDKGVVLLENDTGILSCVYTYPCVGYQLQSMGLNATLVDGRRVILVTDFNKSHTGLPLLITETHTTFDDSTPAPIPVGTAAPPLSPALADTLPPTVTGVPPLLAFNNMTMTPATVTVTFTLFSDNPLMWELALINAVAGYEQDITNGLPPGLLVSPPGGTWTTSSLSVTMIMNSIFMASLGVGAHQIFMTGINQRGISSYAQVDLAVS